MPHNKSIRASIVGITGYTGLELLRLLLAHPNIEIAHLTARDQENSTIGDLYPHLAHLDYKITTADTDALIKDSDIVFIALPHRTAQDIVAELHGKVKIIDLSADYRLDDEATYNTYYGAHKHPHLLKEVTYGLPEINAEAIKTANTVANPGCFALLGQMLLHPFKGLIESADIIAITGSSGAGKTPAEGTHHPIRSHNLKSYNINAHRHIPEITRAAGISADQLNFIPSSGPFTRGIFANAFITLKADNIEPQDLAEQAYETAPFVRLQNSVALANIIGSNFVDLSFTKGQDNRIIAQGALDNLVKGAAGCALQNMNLIFGLDEGAGLFDLSPVYP